MNFVLLQKCIRKNLSVNFRLRIMFLFVIILCFFGVIVNFFHSTDIRLCFVDTTPLEEHTNHLENLPQKLEDILTANTQPDSGKSIFFHETSCGLREESLRMNVNTLKRDSNVQESHINFISLSARQACAIESAAIHNPSSKVFVLFASPRYMLKTNSSARDPIIDALTSYTNIYLRNLNLWTYASGTPIFEWFEDGSLFKSK